MEEVIIYFPGDPSVGINGYGYTMQIPDINIEEFGGTLEEWRQYRNEIRERIKALYTEIDTNSCIVYFSKNETL